MRDLRKRIPRWGRIAGITLSLAVIFLSPAFTAHAQDEMTQAADPVQAAAVLVGEALAATDVQAVINLLEGPNGAHYDASFSASGDDGVGIIPHLEAATGLSAADTAELESDDPLVQALIKAVAVDQALTLALAGGDGDPAALLQEQAATLQEIEALLTGA